MTVDEIRTLAENDLEFFIKLVDPSRVLGDCHKEVIQWWQRSGAKSHQLLLFPRDHMKSGLVAFRVAQALAKDPTLRVLYISSTSNLAEKQLGFIKNIIDSKLFSRYWPLHLDPEEGRREKWTSSEIALDHPKRKEENIRDPSVFTAGLTTKITGMHCDIAVLDDVVVYENAYTKEGREKVQTQYSLLSSIEGADSKEWVVGTRYFPTDLYGVMLEMREEIFDEDGEIIREEPIYEVFERAVEDRGDGTGEFLWPRQMRKDGKYFGFNRSILAKKRGQYLDRVQFRAQYYNDPTDFENLAINPEHFQYYDKKFLEQHMGDWWFKRNKLKVYAAVDFAYTTKKTSDYTAIVVIGVDHENNYYVLDISRFRTDRISVMFENIMNMHEKWGFRKLRAEATAAQSIIINDLKENYIKPYGLLLSIDHYYPSKMEGSKEERIAAALEPRYDNLQMWHYRGGNCSLLEEELISHNPVHDDIKDALASVCTIAKKPSQRSERNPFDDKVIFHERFGGRAH